jgi:transcriptional regulator with XRE-family HTH domain
MVKVSAAQRLRERLDEKGWNQTRLSDELGIRDSTVSRWLSGERSPSRDMACRIEAVLGIPVEAWQKSA